ncbi:hypothetical protein [Streptomyces litchfieldiae]|uniref:Uncharacterized protein n=1 Tax=Streptomyces litchfieldiae TaxID=3075543 RepID=A0ABU2N0X9_9ACTN|nr:hypothetical protein [Streptomyces sp. DSM 44938]MDT0347539.1 hypothetical protein [Streptomyces sp. DSM 44938]
MSHTVPRRRRRAARRTRRRALIRRELICVPCAVAWRGSEADCWNCGQPATSAHHRSALQQLLASVGNASTGPAWKATR